jgi:SnoaL-like domain
MTASQEDIQAKQSIQDVLNRYMLAIDLADVATLRDKVFTSDARIALLQEVPVPEYCDLVAGIMTKIRTQHFLMNTVATIKADRAQARSYFLGYHRVQPGPQGDACKALFGELAQETDAFIGGLYEDELVCRESWKISRRQIRLLWQQQLPAGQLLSPTWLKT